jgi:tetratricopeptide (TPR) repeat protein
VSDDRWATARLDEIGRSGARSEWIPIRKHFGIASFGVNAWSGAEGEEVVGEHDEVPSGHEELYVVVDGHATFVVDGETVDAPTGTIVFVRDPATKRAARAAAGGATILSAGAKPGEAFRPMPWEINSEVFPLFDKGEYAEVKRLLEEAMPQYEGNNGVLLYNLACAEARLGEKDAALDHLAQAVALEDRFAEYARDDEDLAAIRDDPRFPAATPA